MRKAEIPYRQPGSRASAASAAYAWQAPAPLQRTDRILRVQGYKDMQKVRPIISKTAAAMAARAAAIAKPEGLWRLARISSLEDGLLTIDDGTIDDGTILSCPAFDRLLKGASSVVPFVLTLGRDFDNEVIRLIDEFEPLEALLLESAGWLTIESLTRAFAKELRRELAGNGLILGRRMGPGYSYKGPTRDGDDRTVWPLEQQQELFRLFGDAPLPVELMASSAMKPKMSRSGLFGVHE